MGIAGNEYTASNCSEGPNESRIQKFYYPKFQVSIDRTRDRWKMPCAVCGYWRTKYTWYSKKTRPELNDKKLCDKCYGELQMQDLADTPPKEKRLWVYKNCKRCGYALNTPIQKEKTEEHDLFDWGFGSISGETKTRYEYESNWKCSKFNLNINSNADLAENCSSYISQTDYEKKCLSGEMEREKEPVQIILDFTSLKDVMSKGGLVMTTCKCPNCGGMVDIPEAGKVLVCRYCGAPIKPVDIFEKIKSLIQ